MGAVCLTSEDEDPELEQKEQVKRVKRPAKHYAVGVVDAFDGRPGFYSQSYFARCLFKDFIDNIGDLPTETASDIPVKWTTITGFIAGADGLSTEERDLTIKSALQWSGEKASVQTLGDALDKGAKMSAEEAIAFAKEIVKGTGGNVSDGREHIPILYFSLAISRVDGLTEEEKDHFVKIAKAMGCSQDIINELIDTYLLEVKFSKAMEKLMKGKMARQISVTGIEDKWDKE